jgi:capsular polysaccharide transport system permease protein
MGPLQAARCIARRMPDTPLQLPPDRPRIARDAWAVQRAVLFALLLREMKGRVGGQWVGALWTLVEPLAHVLVMITIFSIARGGGFPGIEYPVFLATGLVPFFLFQNMAMRLMDGISANRGLFAYRQVKPIDTLAARAVVELLMNLLVYVFTLGLLGWLGFHVMPTSPLDMFAVHAVLFFLGAGFGTFAAVIGHDRARLRSLIRILMFPLYIASGILFPVHLAPPEVLHWLQLNPLLHLVELSRHAFIAQYELLPQVNLLYPVLFTLTLCTLALLAYRADRLRLVTNG